VRLIIVLTSILAFGVVAYDLVTDRQRTEQAALDSARQQALVQSRAAAEMVQASLDRFDFALQTAREAAIAGPGAMAFQEQVIARTLPSNLALQQFRIGADGYLEYSSLGPAPRNYLGDRDYFKELAADKADRLVVSPPCWAGSPKNGASRSPGRSSATAASTASSRLPCRPRNGRSSWPASRPARATP
jgi:hypothetical protein